MRETDMSEQRAYRYETHLHTNPVSKCSKIDVRAALEFYKKRGYAGVFITNHLLSGQATMENYSSYEELIEFYFSDYEKALSLASEVGIQVLLGHELSLSGTHFLVYGLDKEWFLTHSELVKMTDVEKLKLFRESGALVVQAHPFRVTKVTDFHRVFPMYSDGVEIHNGGDTELEDEMALKYADHYSLPHFAGTDFHGRRKRCFCGIEADRPIESESEFIAMFRRGELRCFTDEITV